MGITLDLSNKLKKLRTLRDILLKWCGSRFNQSYCQLYPAAAAANNKYNDLPGMYVVYTCA